MQIEAKKPCWLALIGGMDNAACGRLLVACNNAIAMGHDALHLMIHSAGGFCADGIAMHNILRAQPLLVTTYNIGSVSSAAVWPYLGGTHRVCDATGVFLIHRPAGGPGGHGPAVQSALESLDLDESRSRALLHQHLTLTAEQLAIYETRDLLLGPQAALAAQLAHEIAPFSPKGQFFLI